MYSFCELVCKGGVSVCVYVCVCVHVCGGGGGGVCVYACKCACLHVRVFVSTCAYVHMRKYAFESDRKREETEEDNILLWQVTNSWEKPIFHAEKSTVIIWW